MSNYQTVALMKKVDSFGGLDKVIELYNSGLSARDVAKKVGIGYTGVCNLLKNNGVKMRNANHNKRKYTLNESVFDGNLTEESAYWLGFIMGDGTVTKSYNKYNVIAVTLNKKDIEHLEKLRLFFGTDKNLYEVSQYRTYMFSINSSVIAKDIEHYGIIPRKSYNETEMKNIPKELERHFWRGLIDADGHIRQDKKNDKWYIGLTGSKRICEQFKEFILSQGIKTKANVHQVSENGYRIEFGGKALTLLIIKLLYDNNTISLDRKQKIAEEIMAYGEKENPVQGRR